MAGAGFHSLAKLRTGTQMCTTIVAIQGLNTANCQELGISAVHLRAVCQGVIPVVANRGIFARA
jgi:hypothetical protein